MEIRSVYPPFIYAVKYSGDRLNIFRLTLKNLTDEEYLEKFFTDFQDQISDYLLERLPFNRDEIEEFIAETNDQMIDLREELDMLCKSKQAGESVNLGEYFQPHSKIDFGDSIEGGGKSKEYGVEYLPVKCYGPSRPSLVRLYAIELSHDCYIIIYGGIKIHKTTETSPTYDSDGKYSTLEKELRNYIIKVCNFLKDNFIVDKPSLLDYMNESHEPKY